MISARLRELPPRLCATVQGGDAAFTGISTDSRTIRPGELFVALKGPRFDGHASLDEALSRGAAAALVEREVVAEMPRVRVASTRLGLRQLGAMARERHRCKLVGITGSNGKTTVKELVAAILGVTGPVLATRGNLNNDIGVPLTLSRLGPEHRHAVVEMGANHPGEIACLAALARPDVAAVTLCAPAHIEGFGSVERVARSKAEIYEGLAPDGVAVLNVDDPYADLWREIIGPRRIVTFSLRRDADVTARNVAIGAEGSRFELCTPAGSTMIDLALPGMHNVQNAVAAAACTLPLNVTLDAVAAGLAGARPVKGRMELRRGPGGSVVYDDTYNANPASLRAAVEQLVRLPGEHWLVLGDMAELGPSAEELHREAGRMARELGVHRLWTVGELSRHAAEGFGEGAEHCADIECVHATLLPGLRSSVALLVKGSRSARMERLVELLAPEF